MYMYESRIKAIAIDCHYAYTRIITRVIIRKRIDDLID